MATHFVNELNAAVTLWQTTLPTILLFIACLFFIHCLNWLLGHRLAFLGVYPRKWFSVLGIAFYPFIHSDFNHLFFNAIPLFILICFTLLNGVSQFFCVSITIILLGGLGIWLFARPGFHIGASGLIMGYWSYLLMNAYQHGLAEASLLTVAPAVVCLYYFGGFLFQLFPTQVKTSWEAHLYGFLGGIAAAYACPTLICKYSTFLCSKML